MVNILVISIVNSSLSAVCIEGRQNLESVRVDLIFLSGDFLGKRLSCIFLRNLEKSFISVDFWKSNLGFSVNITSELYHKSTPPKQSGYKRHDSTERYFKNMEYSKKHECA